MKQQRFNWVIHLVANTVCDECGKEENGFLPYACNAHTHDMEQYDHPDFQLVLLLPRQEICRILNTMGMRVRSGERFKAGDYVSGIYDDCQIRLDAFEETGRTVLRVIIPDKYGKFPEEANCMDSYKLQQLPTESLYLEGGIQS